MANLMQGMSGNEVKDLQQKLISAGYGNYLGAGQADGIFGAKTYDAVRRYQKDNGLAVDGIAGVNTMGSLNTFIANKNASAGTTNTAKLATTSAQTQPAAPTKTTQPDPFTYKDFTYGDFAASDVVQQAQASLQQQQAAKPGEYKPVWQDEADAYLSQYQNRDPFSYDPNSDALYQYYRDMYIQQGQLAMMDAMGQAAAMTGGYANSYAQSAGQQAYNQFLGQLNTVLPELYQMAEDRYDQEGEDLRAMYELYQAREAEEERKYQASYDRWAQEMARLQGNYDALYEREYNEYLDDKNTAYNDYLTGRNEAYDAYQKAIDRDYQAGRDAVADAQWQATFDENKRQADRAYNLQTSRSTGDNTGDDIPVYTRYDSGLQSIYEKEFSGANSYAQLEDVWDRLVNGENVDPAEATKRVKYWASQKNIPLPGQGQTPTKVDSTQQRWNMQKKKEDRLERTK